MLRTGIITSIFATIYASSASACFPDPESRPLIGCMPFHFGASGPIGRIDWGYSEFKEKTEQNKSRVNDESTRVQFEAYYPEERCARISSDKHIHLIERLYAQMLNGAKPDAFSAIDHDLGFYEQNKYDSGAVYKIRDFTPPYIREYYPSLFAIIRDYEQCMIEVHELGCQKSNQECRIFGFQYMGYLPDGSQFPFLESAPDFSEEIFNEPLISYETFELSIEESGSYAFTLPISIILFGGANVSIQSCYKLAVCRLAVLQAIQDMPGISPIYIPPPEILPGFPDAIRVKNRTGRKRWIDSKGKIYEWDSQHGKVEVYDKTGKKHLGEFDPETGDKEKDGEPGRTTER